MAQGVSRCVLTGRVQYRTQVGFVMDKGALRQVLSETIGFALSVSFHRWSIFTHVLSGEWKMTLYRQKFRRETVSPLRNSSNKNSESCVYGPEKT
jgi:hypothetical protein